MTKALTHTQFNNLICNMDESNPSAEDLAAIRSALSRNPQLVHEACDLARQAQYKFIYNANWSPVAQEYARAVAELLKRDLEYEKAPVLEQLAIDQVVLCYLRLNYREWSYSGAMGSKEMSFEEAHEWEKLLGNTQKRYLRALEVLARIRRLGISIQVNIATEGGQQINLNRS